GLAPAGSTRRAGPPGASAGEPEVWFREEPAPALDPLIRREMQDEFLRLQNVLRKTIVFITHDFDEAIRLADRIAIMQDGEIIQIGTPEDLVARPATAYVAEFTRDVQRAKVISAGTLMRPCRDGTTYAARVRAGDRAASFAAAIVGSAEPFGVVDESGALIGEIRRDDVIDLLAGRKVTCRSHQLLLSRRSEGFRHGRQSGFSPSRRHCISRDIETISIPSLPTSMSIRTNGSCPFVHGPAASSAF